VSSQEFREFENAEEAAVDTAQIQARLSGAPELLSQLLKKFNPETLHDLLKLDLDFSLEHLPDIPNIGAIDTLIREIKEVAPLPLEQKLEALANALAPVGVLLLENHRALDRIDQNFTLKRKVILDLIQDIELESARNLRNSSSDYHCTQWPKLFNELKMLKELKGRIGNQENSNDVELAQAIRAGLESKNHKQLRLEPNKEIKKVLEALNDYESAEIIHALQITKESVGPLIALLERLKEEVLLRRRRETLQHHYTQLRTDPLEIFRATRWSQSNPTSGAYQLLTSKEKDNVILALVHEIEESGSNPFRFLWNRYLQDCVCKLLKVENEGLETFKRALVAISATSKKTDAKILQIILALPMDNAELIHRLSDYSHQFPDEVSVQVALNVLKRKQLISRLVEDPSEIAAAQAELLGSDKS